MDTDDIRPRYKYGSGTNSARKLSSSQTSSASDDKIAPAVTFINPRSSSESHISRKYLYAGFVLVIICAGVILVGFAHRPKAKSAFASSPVPPAISRAVGFLVYYPASDKLPRGYSLDKKSFILSPQKNGVAYAVKYGDGNKIEITIQSKPSDSELQSATNNFIPLHNELQTPVGQAEIGAYNNHGQTETFVSLPVTNGPWIIMTAPYDIDQSQLKQVVLALRK